ncbi:sulfite exporter TauE/SafE [Variibacter gotjawalensis]|uniref:Probable membrane transporter protein n=1 Tax=Variibacter gotjawalensis TaxID=1333996 RepID=A0A0S3PSL1_9BRAD|nr:sulfite exporter TauE/SafE family protein [Variibacter gotjawalensis]NIK49222.1 putative membrane protein YfcA [Variibacter gotjawalensis]RZS51075.1 sulfite exporter TauE/SafE [Variibacter gotjawalensis]BAT58909.1 sulfite exporter TauE/SafE [Variibacter gotjawalensis]
MFDSLYAALAAVPPAELVLVAVMAFVASLIGGVAGYGTGVLMPLVLVPIAEPENVVPIVGMTALFTNPSRAVAFREYIDWRRVGIVAACALPTCILGAYGFTRLTGRGALIVIACTLLASVPLRRILQSRGFVIGDRGLGIGAVGYGVLVGGTSGSGIVLLSLLLACGLTGRAVVATDAMVSVIVGIAKVSVFGIAGVLTPKVIAFALMIGVVVVPGAFIAKALVERMPVRVHTAILDGVIIIGGVFLMWNAFAR